MKKNLTLICLLLITLSYAQRDFGTPTNESLPEKLQNLKRAIVVKNYPKEIDPIKIKDQYYWKHNTMIFHKTSEVKIIEFGA